MDFINEEFCVLLLHIKLEVSISNIISGFYHVLFLFIGERKDNSISLTWNVTTTTLNLICKIENLKWQVEIFDPSGVEQGFCVPHPLPECHKNFPNDTTLNQNITTNLTIFTRSISNSTNFNGLWRCNHGTNADKALTNVIIDKQEGKL